MVVSPLRFYAADIAAYAYYERERHIAAMSAMLRHTLRAYFVTSMMPMPDGQMMPLLHVVFVCLPLRHFARRCLPFTPCHLLPCRHFLLLLSAIASLSLIALSDMSSRYATQQRMMRRGKRAVAPL